MNTFSHSDGIVGVNGNYNGKLTTVEIIDFSTGIIAKGHAKLHPDDEFDPIIGVKLATIRAHQRLLRKLEKAIVKEPEIATW